MRGRPLDAERHRLTGTALADAIAAARPDVVMTGHAGSTPAHPACLLVLQAARARCPAALTVYGGPYPTFHAADILRDCPALDVVVQEDVGRWDYRHQLLGTKRMAPWQVFLSVKLMEAVVHLRPRALRRVLLHPDEGLRAHLRWCFRNSARVWWAEIAEFLFRTRRPRQPRTLAEWFGQAAPGRAQALAMPSRSAKAARSAP